MKLHDFEMIEHRLDYVRSKPKNWKAVDEIIAMIGEK